MRIFISKNSIFPFVLPFVLILAFTGVSAQTLNTKSKYLIGDNWGLNLNLGATQFYGDVNSQNYFQKWKGESVLGLQLNLQKMFNPALGVGVSFYYTGLKSIKDRKADGTRVNYSLGGHYYDLGAYIYTDFNNLFAGYKPGRKLSVYGTLGLGYGIWKTYMTNNITGTILYSGMVIGSHTFKDRAFSIPLGAGVNYSLSNHWAVHAGGTFTTVLSDDVDVWHDGFKYDQLFYTNIGITYYIKPTWDRNILKKIIPDNKRKRAYERKMKKHPIPIFDYMINPEPETPVKKRPNLNLLYVPKPISSPVVSSVKTTPSRKGLEFRVQIMAFNKPLQNPSLLQAKYRLPFPVEMVHQDGLYRYTVGRFTSYNKALIESRRILRQGIPGAFVTAYRNGLRVALTKEMVNQ